MRWLQLPTAPLVVLTAPPGAEPPLPELARLDPTSDSIDHIGIIEQPHRQQAAVIQLLQRKPLPRLVLAGTAWTQALEDALPFPAVHVEAAPLLVSELRERRPLLDDVLVAPIDVTRVLKRLPPGDDALDRLGDWGGAPSVLARAPRHRRRHLRKLLDDWLAVDLPALAPRVDPADFRRFMAASAAHSGALLSVADLARDAGLSPSTARRYQRLLLDARLAFEVPSFRRKLSGDPVAAPRVVWSDPGLAHAATGAPGPAGAAMAPATLMAQVVGWLRTRRAGLPWWHYRTRSGLGVDLLIRTPGGFVGVSTSPRAAVHPADSRGLRTLARALGRRWRAGLLLTPGDQVERLDWRCWAVPAGRLL